MQTTPLKKVRTARNISLAALGAAVGASAPHLSNIENLQADASPDLAERLAKFFAPDLTELHILYPRRFMTAEQGSQTSPAVGDQK